jgi:hypothetical protein
LYGGTRERFSPQIVVLESSQDPQSLSLWRHLHGKEK